MAEVAEQLANVIRAMVDDGDAVEIDVLDEPDAVVFQVRVAPDELGRVIGRQGRTVRALRTLLEVRGTESGDYYELEILDP